MDIRTVNQKSGGGYRESPGISFPARVAGVDIGSNAIRFTAAEFDEPGRFTTLCYERFPLRLGHDVFLSGRMTAETIDAAIEGLNGFVERMKENGTGLYRAIATSAVRESNNGDLFLKRVEEEVGMHVEVISGSEEARLVHHAVRNRIDLGTEQWVLADLGGGSVEVSLADGDGILWSESHTMGSVRLLEELAGAGEEPGRFKNLLAEYVAVLRMPAIIREKKPAGFIATGGNIEALAHLAAHPDADGVSRLRVADLQNLIEKMARMSFNDRIRELNLKEDRADVILPAALVYERLALLVGVEEIIVPHVSLLEGVLLDLVGGAVQREGFEEKQTYEGAVSLGKKYLFEEAHALQVARFSLNLFDQLQSLHRLQERERRILLAAAILHDIGTFISFKKHHKHSLYIISQSELPGFSPEEMLMIANIARYHRKSSPADRHDQYTKLAAGDRERVCALSSILRMADALDREHLQKISDVKVEQIRDGEMRLRIRGEGDLLLERWALKNKSRYFSELFDLQVRYEIEEDAS